MGSTYLEQNPAGMAYLQSILNQGRPYNKTIFLVLSDDQIEIAKSCVREAVGDIEGVNVGIMFTLPVLSVEGIRN